MRTIVVALLFVSLPCLSYAAAHDDDAAAPPTVSEAWTQLKTAAAAKSVDERVHAQDALGVLTGMKEAEALVRAGFKDTEMDVRIAAIGAAGEMKDAALSNDMRKLMDDGKPEVAFAAASTLWKMGDHSGEDILEAVVTGNRKTDSGLLKSGVHHADRTVHNPVTLAKEGGLMIGSILLPPVGIGMGAYRYMHSEGGQNPRVIALSQLAQEHNDGIRDVLIGATQDKDAAVRIAAAESLVKYSGPVVKDALGKMMIDSRSEARLVAAAVFIRVSEGGSATRAVKKAK